MIIGLERPNTPPPKKNLHFCLFYVARINVFAYTVSIVNNTGKVVKRSELMKQLSKLGATFKEGAKHTKVFLNGTQTTIPRHSEIDEHLAEAIKKQLKLKK